MKRKFLAIGATGCVALVWLVNTVLGGILYATAAFFTQESLERWKNKKDAQP